MELRIEFIVSQRDTDITPQLLPYDVVCKLIVLLEDLVGRKSHPRRGDAVARGLANRSVELGLRGKLFDWLRLALAQFCLQKESI